MIPTPEMIEAAVVAVSENVDWVRGLFGLDYDNAQDVMRDALTAALALLPGEPVAQMHDSGDGLGLRPLWLGTVPPEGAQLFAAPAPLPVAVKIVVTDNIVRTAMQDAWNDICDDTGCHPLDIQQLGRKRIAFSPSHWANAVAEGIRSALSQQEESRG